MQDGVGWYVFSKICLTGSGQVSWRFFQGMKFQAKVETSSELSACWGFSAGIKKEPFLARQENPQLTFIS